MNNDCPGCGPRGQRPFYEMVNDEVLQDHKTVYTSTVFAAGIRINEQWVVPEENEDIAVEVPNLTDIPVGEYFHSAQYGYFKISQWNPKLHRIGLLNEKIPGTASPGSTVAAGTLFVITPKPCCQDDTSTLFPFLAEDFVAPNVSGTRTIEVTSTFGLKLGELVRISTGVYRLSLINSSKQIVITNEGAGITPGTDVMALDANGEYQYLIITENVAACNASDVETGRLVVCDGSVEKILSGAVVHSVPVLVDEEESLVEFKLLDADVRVCTELTSNLVITTDEDDYLVGVSDSSDFEIGDIFQISTSDLRFYVGGVSAGILDSRIDPPGWPPANETILAGATVCKILTSEALANLIDQTVENLQDQIDALEAAIVVTSSNLATVAANLASEVTNRTNADNTLQTNINTEITNRTNAVSAEATARGNADSTLQTNINTEITNRTNAVSAEATARANADSAEITARTNAVSSEAGTRSSADTNLQNQIDTINNVYISQYGLAQNATASALITPINLASNGSQANGNYVEIVLTNAGSRNMIGIFNSVTEFGGVWNTGGNADPRLQFSTLSEVRTGSIGSTAAMMGTPQLGRSSSDRRRITIDSEVGEVISHNRSFVISGGQEVRARFFGTITMVDKSGANHLIISNNSISTYLDAIGIAI